MAGTQMIQLEGFHMRGRYLRPKYDALPSIKDAVVRPIAVDFASPEDVVLYTRMPAIVWEVKGERRLPCLTSVNLLYRNLWFDEDGYIKGVSGELVLFLLRIPKRLSPKSCGTSEIKVSTREFLGRPSELRIAGRLKYEDIEAKAFRNHETFTSVKCRAYIHRGPNADPHKEASFVAGSNVCLSCFHALFGFGREGRYISLTSPVLTSYFHGLYTEWWKRLRWQYVLRGMMIAHYTTNPTRNFSADDYSRIGFATSADPYSTIYCAPFTTSISCGLVAAVYGPRIWRLFRLMQRRRGSKHHISYMPELHERGPELVYFGAIFDMPQSSQRGKRNHVMDTEWSLLVRHPGAYKRGKTLVSRVFDTCLDQLEHTAAEIELHLTVESAVRQPPKDANSCLTTSIDAWTIRDNTCCLVDAENLTWFYLSALLR